MERSLYFETYICNKQKDIFLYANKQNYPIEEFIHYYMKSPIRKQMDQSYAFWHTQPCERIVEEIVDLYDLKPTGIPQTINLAAIEWLGYFYAKWQFITNEPSATIVRFLPPIKGLKSYFVLHQLDYEDAINRCKSQYNVLRNNHRRNEIKINKENINEINNSHYYSFLASRILYKLSKDPIYKNLEYVKKEQPYDFEGINSSFSLKVDVISSNSCIKLNELYFKSKEEINDKLNHINTNIYFCFVKSIYYLDNLVNFLNDLSEVRDNDQNTKQLFKSKYFYIDGAVYEITPSNEIMMYVVPLSKRDKSGLYNKMKENGLEIL